ncbi:MAG: TraR/DksA family transcriptional regulator [Phycisphaerae bacterium]|nr:TraR/DksA family transcriptional regulator [Phycisphaerae bacterium]
MAKKVTKKKASPGQSGGAKKTVKKTVKKAKKTVKKASSANNGLVAVAKKNRVKAVRKTAAPKPSSGTTAPVENLPKHFKTYLTKNELEHFRGLLIGKLKQITGDVNHIEEEFLRKSRQDSTGDLSSMPIHMADIGSDNYEQEFSLGLMATEQKIVQEIMIALRRIENGTYGMCEGTGEAIPKTRLEAFPWARYCVRYAEMLEKGQVAPMRDNSYSSGNFAPSLADAEEVDDDDDDEEESYEDDDAFDAEEADDDDQDDQDDDKPFYN